MERVAKSSGFKMVANVLARTVPGESAFDIARTSSDCVWGADQVRAIEAGIRLQGLYDVSPVALPRLSIDSASVVDVLLQEAREYPLGVRVRVDLFESAGLSQLKGTAIKRLAHSAAAPDGRGLVDVAALECVRSAGNARAIKALLDEAQAKVRSSGSSSAAVLEDLTSAAVQLSIRPDSRLFLIMTAHTAATLALKSSNGAPAFPNLSLGGGEISAAVRALVVDSADLPVTEEGGHCALLVDAAGLLMNPGQVGLGRVRAKGEEAAQAEADCFQLKAVRTFGLEPFRNAVAVIEELKW